jgi:hypothetical protein
MSITFNSPQLKFYGSSGTLLGTCPVFGNVTSVSGILSFSCPTSGQFTNWTTVTLTSTNHLTGKRKITTGMSAFDDQPDRPKVTWEDLESRKPMYLEDLPPCGRAQ